MEFNSKETSGKSAVETLERCIWSWFFCVESGFVRVKKLADRRHIRVSAVPLARIFVLLATTHDVLQSNQFMQWLMNVNHKFNARVGSVVWGRALMYLTLLSLLYLCRTKTTRINETLLHIDKTIAVKSISVDSTLQTLGQLEPQNTNRILVSTVNAITVLAIVWQNQVQKTPDVCQLQFSH